MDASVGRDGRGEGVDHLLELDAVAVGEQEPQEVMPRSPFVRGLRVQVHQGLGVRCVPGLRLLRLGQAEVIEEQLLELLGARQVDLAAGGSPRSLARGIDGLAEFIGESIEHGRVCGNADVFHLTEQDRQRHLHVDEQRGLGAFLQARAQSRGKRVQVSGQLPGAHLGRTRARSHVAEIEESLRVTLLFLDHDAKHTREHILQLVGALIGMREVRRQHRVALDGAESPAARRKRMARTLRVVHDKGRGRGQDLAECFLLLGAQFDGVDHERLVVRGEDKAGDVATSGPHVALNEHSERRVGASPLGNVAGSIREGHRDLHLGHSLGRLVDAPLPHADARDLAHLLTQTTKFERIKETIDGCDIRGAAGQITGRHLKVHVGEQAIEAAVAHDVIHVFAQGRSALAADFVGPRQQVVQAVVLVNPLRGSLRADARNTGQVIRGLTHDCGNLGIAMRRHAVLVLHRLRSHTAQIAGPRARVQHGHIVSHRLEGVAVA